MEVAPAQARPATPASQVANRAGWVAGDEIYGADPTLRRTIRQHGLGYLLQVAANRRVPTAAGPIRVDQLPALVPKRAWQRHSAGKGSKGHRYYSWAWIALQPEDPEDRGRHWVLIRRNHTTGELAYHRCYPPHTVPLSEAFSASTERSCELDRGASRPGITVGPWTSC